MEHLALDAGQRQNRHIDDHDDDLAEGRRGSNLLAGRVDDLEPFFDGQWPTELVLFLREDSEAVLHDDYRAIDDQAKINGPQAHEVAADAGLDHPRDGEQHGQRDGQRGDHCGSKIPHQEKKNDDDQDGSLGQVLLDCADRGIDQLRAVEHGLDLNIRRQRLSDFGNFFIDGDRDGAAIRSDQHHRRADYDFLAIFAGAAGAQFFTDCHGGHVADVDRRTGTPADDDLSDFFLVVDPPSCADRVVLARMLDVPGAGRDVVALQSLDDIVEGQAVCDEFHGIGLDVILLDIAADRIHAGHVFHSFELWPDDPVLHGSQIGAQFYVGLKHFAFEREVRSVALPSGPAILEVCPLAIAVFVVDGPHVDLAQPGGDRAHFRFRPGRQTVAGFEQSFADLLTREIDIDVIVEDRCHLREAVA